MAKVNKKPIAQKKTFIALIEVEVVAGTKKSGHVEADDIAKHIRKTFKTKAEVASFEAKPETNLIEEDTDDLNDN